MVRILELKKDAKERKIPIMQDEGMEFFLSYVKEHHLKNILEIGTAVGYSAIRLSQVSKDIHITTLERDKKRYEEALRNFRDCEVEGQVTAILGDALELEISGTYDCIFIDAAKSQYIKFFEKYKHLLAPNGVILSDNLSFHGMVEDPSKTNNRNTKQLVKKIREYIEFLKNNEEFETVFYSVGDGISISKRNNK